MTARAATTFAGATDPPRDWLPCPYVPWVCSTACPRAAEISSGDRPDALASLAAACRRLYAVIEVRKVGQARAAAALMASEKARAGLLLSWPRSTTMAPPLAAA